MDSEPYRRGLDMVKQAQRDAVQRQLATDSLGKASVTTKQDAVRRVDDALRDTQPERI